MSSYSVNDMNCECHKYEHLTLDRKAVSKRIKETKNFKKLLEVVAKHNGVEHQLLKCAACGQLWQSSRAWNWGNDEYLFKVPPIEIEAWLSEPFVQPDEMLIYSAVMQDYVEDNSVAETEKECRTSGCGKRAVELSVFCMGHHIESLQNAGALPKDPKGRWFPPYHRAGMDGDI